MLKRSGRIGENATFTEAEQVLRGYLKERAAQGRIQAQTMSDETVQMMARARGGKSLQSLKNGKGNKLGQAKKNRPAPCNRNPTTEKCGPPAYSPS
ncbi:hypothetical protein ACFQH7_18995 [Microbulbifer taiwanensis]